MTDPTVTPIAWQQMQIPDPNDWLTSMADWFGTGQYAPHGFCLLWDQTLISLYLLGNAGIVFAYLIIPCMLVWFAWRTRAVREVVPTWVLVSFASFIFCCAISHILAVVNLYLDWYWLEAVWLNVTAYVSLFAALSLPFAIKVILRDVARKTVARVLQVPEK